MAVSSTNKPNKFLTAFRFRCPSPVSHTFVGLGDVQGIREQCVLYKDTFTGGGPADGQAGHPAPELGSFKKAGQWLRQLREHAGAERPGRWDGAGGFGRVLKTAEGSPWPSARGLLSLLYVSAALASSATWNKARRSNGALCCSPSDDVLWYRLVAVTTTCCIHAGHFSSYRVAIPLV